MPVESNTGNSVTEFHRSGNSSKKSAGYLFEKSELNGLICIILAMELGCLEADVGLLCSAD